MFAGLSSNKPLDFAAATHVRNHIHRQLTEFFALADNSQTRIK